MNLEEVQQYKSLDILAQQVVEGFITGMHKSPYHGFSVEFAEHKRYNIGESIKNIDWRLYAKTDKLYVKKFDEETNLRCQLVIDTSSSMYFPKGENKKVSFALYASAAIMYLLKKQRDAFGLSLFDDKVYFKSEVKSSSMHFNQMLVKLNDLQEKPKEVHQTNVAATLHQLAGQLHRRSLVVLFSDLFDPGGDLDAIFDALQHLKYNKHEVIVFYTVDGDKELELDYGNRPYRFIDSETKEEIRLHPEEIRDAYLERINSFYKEVKNRCGMARIDFVKADVNKDFSQVLLPFLLKRQKMV